MLWYPFFCTVSTQRIFPGARLNEWTECKIEDMAKPNYKKLCNVNVSCYDFYRWHVSVYKYQNQWNQAGLDSCAVCHSVGCMPFICPLCYAISNVSLTHILIKYHCDIIVWYGRDIWIEIWEKMPKINIRTQWSLHLQRACYHRRD